MKQGKSIPGCSKCYIDEKATGDSLRIRNIKLIEELVPIKFKPPDSPILKYIDIAFSNLCNNRCRMCGPELSTNWYPDAKKLNIPINRGIVDNSDYLANADFSQLSVVKVIGGESLLEQEKFISFLERCNRSQLKLEIITNGSVLPEPRLYKLIKECKKVKWIVSIDAYGHLNDFLRKGSSWAKVTENLRWYEKNFSSITVHGVISMYNINCLEDLPNYVFQNYSGLEFVYTMVDGPPWMELQNFPPVVKVQLLNKIKNSTNAEIIKVKNLIKQQMILPGNFENFLKHDKELNLLRNEHWKDHNPELYEILAPYMLTE
jgi:molybdenum cofactor biosynthesis enzyme MoaA